MTNECSAELLASALAGDLPPQSEERLYRHLDTCDACAKELEQMAGGEASWREAATLLPEDEWDQAIHVRDEWSSADFTVEHLEPADDPNVLGRLGGYDVLEIIGRGGAGIVLKCLDPELKRYVAIKVLAPQLAQSSLARKRFAREAQAAAAVVHPNVLAIHQVQAGGRLPFLVMPLVAGESLAQRLTAEGRLELTEVLRIGMQAAAGLAAAHEQGLVHRDVKPANILLEKGIERVVLSDFGLARAADDVSMTRCGTIAGTPQYMSPEQANGEPLDGRSDLFSLGCVLYEMATGVSPFRADSTLATLRRLIDDAPPAMSSLNPELPPWFVGIVERLLEKDAARRYGTAKEVSELLEGCLAHLQQPAGVPLPAALVAEVPARSDQHTAFPPQKRRWISAAAIVATAGIVLLALLAMPAIRLAQHTWNQLASADGKANLVTIKKFTVADPVLTKSLTVRDGAWTADVKSAETLRLFEVTDPGAENCKVFYRAKLRTKDFKGQVYLEMWCRLPGRGEFFSRGLDNTLTGSTGWVSCETPFFLKPGERPDLIRLNVVAQGTGSVEIKDVELLKSTVPAE